MRTLPPTGRLNRLTRTRRCDILLSYYKFDPQFAYQRFANAFTPALAGVDMLSGVGMAGGLVGSLKTEALMSAIEDKKG